MIISISVAMGKSRQIGLNNKLLWHLPEELKNFKRNTLDHHLLMGRKTFESIGKPLPNRTTIILTRDKSFKHDNCLVTYSLKEGITLARSRGETELFICGGGQIYEQALKYADKLYLTEVDYDGEADTFFPKINENSWKEVENKVYYKNQDHKYQWRYRVLERKLGN